MLSGVGVWLKGARLGIRLLSGLEPCFLGARAPFRNIYREHSLSKCLLFGPGKEALGEQEGSMFP